MKNSTTTYLFSTMLLFQGVASAQSSQQATTNTVKVAEVTQQTEKKADIDKEITDARLRATLGSKSQFSFKTSLTYSGSSVDDPLNGVRPNYRSSPGSLPSMTSLSGDIGINIRAGDRDNISAGTGVSVTDPLHGDLSGNAQDTRPGRSGDIKRYEVSTPYLSWSRGYRVSELQMTSGLSYGFATDSDSVDVYKIAGSATFSQNILMNFGSTGFNGGTSFSLGKTFYAGDIKDPGLLKLYRSGKYKRSELSFGVFPFLQYSFNDKYSFRTVFGYFQFSRYENIDENFQLEPYQSVGVGVSITRDIYLYPNVQFTPKDIRLDRTNVALTANINIL